MGLWAPSSARSSGAVAAATTLTLARPKDSDAAALLQGLDETICRGDFGVTTGGIVERLVRLNP